MVIDEIEINMHQQNHIVLSDFMKSIQNVHDWPKVGYSPEAKKPVKHWLRHKESVMIEIKSSQSSLILMIICQKQLESAKN